MSVFHPNSPVRIFFISALVTIILGTVVLKYTGLAGLWLFVILVFLEVTFSFDNAVINSKVLSRMSELWQKIFLTVGIFIAVFVVRFLLPIVIVMVATQLNFGQVVHLALYDADEYGEILYHASPMINAFGGAFLMMIGVTYFINRKKDIHWLGLIEEKLSNAGRFENLKVFILLSVAAILYFTVEPSYKTIVLVASVLGIILHIGLSLFGELFGEHQAKSTAKQVGWAAFASFVYLEVLDASFSFDGVIGAFAITDSVILIVAGLGAGAIWVRSFTIYLLRSGTLSKYRYLEHGAHWAILALGSLMVAKLYHFEPPEWVTGSIGILFITTAIASSIIERRRMQRVQQD